MDLKDLATMPLATRMQAMEVLWDSLTRDPYPLPVPDWHKGELDARRRAMDSGEETVSAWQDAKDRIREDARKG